MLNSKHREVCSLKGRCWRKTLYTNFWERIWTLLQYIYPST